MKVESLQFVVFYEKYGLESEAQKNTFEIVGDFIGEQNPYEETLFTSLYRNADFRKRFKDSLSWHTRFRC